MGPLSEFPVMDAKRALCSSSSGNPTDRHIIKDHMISHYKKIYSAKAAVDCTVPRSMRFNVKYIDQKRRQQQKRENHEWAQTVKSHTHKSIDRNTQTRHSSRTGQSDESAQLCMVGGEMSSPRFNTSFHCKQTVREVEEKTVSKLNQQDAYYGRTNNNGGGSAGLDSPLPCCPDHGWSDEESDVFGHYSTANKTKDSDFLLSSSRVSPEGMRSPIMRKVTAEEEELLYLEFITDVTNDIIAHGFYSDSISCHRVLERVFKRHIDMNRHRLNEDKMRHLLDDLHNDLQSPPAASVTALENKERGRSLLLRHKSSSLGQELTSVTADYINLFPCTPFDKDKEEPDSAIPLLSSMPVSVSKSAGTIKQEDENNIEDLDTKHRHKEGNVKFPSLENLQQNEDKYQNFTDQNDLIKQVDELGRNMSESLSVSGTHSLEVVIEQEPNIKCSEDEF
ncbi:uncharacterized protein spata7 isoform X4 [Brachyhypopomus gauderio]|uniref:uncharacterized protein spata7 isoform X4 n=1 Tax=Brachyhypopomus gauderio TaxID=698409 RepID=UPI0040436ABF